MVSPWKTELSTATNLSSFDTISALLSTSLAHSLRHGPAPCHPPPPLPRCRIYVGAMHAVRSQTLCDLKVIFSFIASFNWSFTMNSRYTIVPYATTPTHRHITSFPLKLLTANHITKIVNAVQRVLQREKKKRRKLSAPLVSTHSSRRD